MHIVATLVGIAWAEPTCQDRANGLFQGDAESQRVAHSWNALEILLASSTIDVVPADWVNQDAVPLRADTVAADAEQQHRANWRAAWAWAFARFDAFAEHCSPGELVPLDSTGKPLDRSSPFGVMSPPDVIGMIDAYQADNGVKVSSAALVELLGSPGGVPTPQPLQIALTQVTTAGQPGFVGTLGSAPWARNNSALVRHLTFSGSTLIVSPSQPSGGGSVEPTFASGEFVVATALPNRAYDWLRGRAKQQPVIEARFRELVLSAEQDLVYLYKLRPADVAKETAFTGALSSASATLLAHSVEYFGEALVRPEDEKVPTAGTFYARGRYTPDATWVPELPDLLSAGLGAAYYTAFSKTQDKIGGAFHASLSLSYSDYSTTPTADGTPVLRTADFPASHPAVLGDVWTSLDVLAPTTPAGRPYLTASATLRFASRELAEGIPELSFGAKGALTVPVSPGIAIQAAFLSRWELAADGALEQDSLAGVTLATAIGG